MKAISRHEAADLNWATSPRGASAEFRAEQKWLVQLRRLTPPASTGVTVSVWKKAVDVQFRDVRAALVLYGKEFPTLLRSWKRPPSTPKLPSGTGATASILAQAFNSPEGRRFLRLQNKLFKQMEADAPGWKRVLSAVGILKVCG
jgi:hypothetical protein